MTHLGQVPDFLPLSGRPQRLYDLWNAWRGERSMPSRQDVLPEELRGLLPYVALMQATPDPLDCRYIISGEAVDRASERGVKGMTIREVLEDGGMSIANEIADMYGGVINGKQPSFTRGSMDYRDRGYIKFDRVLLPLSADDQVVDHLLCGFFYDFD